MHWTAAYQGLPFHDGGRDRSGLDCYGLVRLVLAEHCGIALPDYADISAFDAARVAQLMGGEALAEIPWIEVSRAEARAFDVLVMRRHGSRDIGHVGVMVDGRQVFHIEQGIEAVCLPLSHYTIAPRVVAFRRHRALCSM